MNYSRRVFTKWTATGLEVTVPWAMADGVVPDTDHLLDYYLWCVPQVVIEGYLFTRY